MSEKKQPKPRKRTTLQALRNWVREENIRDEEVVWERYFKCVDKISAEDAMATVMRQKFLRFLASIRDERGLRNVFPYTDKHGDRRIHIVPGTPDMEAVAAIDGRLARNQQGNRRTRRPVRKYRKELAEQIVLGLEVNGK